jgi:hypothetical protein
MITKFNSTPMSTPDMSTTKSGSGMGTIVIVGLIAVAAWFGYKEYQKSKEKQD